MPDSSDSSDSENGGEFCFIYYELVERFLPEFTVVQLLLSLITSAVNSSRSPNFVHVMRYYE